MDTMTLTKVTAALCGALLVFLLGKWAADVMYSVESKGDPAYVIEVADDNGGQEEVVQISFDEMMAAADIGKGASVFKKCAACHKLGEGVNAAGPSLFGIVGRPIASEAGFGYSSAMAGKGGDWTVEALDAFLTKPSADISGTSMSFSGLKKQNDRINLIAYLDSLDD